MGSIFDFINNLVEWVSEVINKVVVWFHEFRDFIENKNRQFLLKNETKFKNANNPKQLAKVGTECDSLKELKKMLLMKQKLDSKDQETLKDLFKDDPDFFNN